ncbi:lipocalin-like domain-containing protein [Fulvivirga sp. 29W222]|uniref:Lipocalin-like domain-containing protein n=1 Tax=Fulvivirga marina TaxID=2494733 RepID=A0A937G3V8_9BACT|nr:lipocalin-like domain-containing protein [Fulvivirga marina]MBL6447956.1 lipocalin-like domain-containing protein [Fulvivirga marina]
MRNMKKVMLTLLAFASALSVFAQKNDVELVGPWSLVSIDNIYPDGTRVHPYGENPDGLLMFDDEGNYAIQILRASRPKIASADKNNCTPEEYASIVKGTNSHYGTYQLNSTEKTITFNIAHASFPNWEGTVQERSFTLENNKIKYVVTRTTQGGQSVIAEVVWEKM